MLRWRSDRGSMRMMTNSAGFTDAMPMTTTSLPLSMSVWVILGEIDFDEIGFLGSGAPLERRSRQNTAQGIAQSAIGARPDRLRVSLEDHPLQLSVDGSLDENPPPPHIDILPVWIVGDDAGGPKCDWRDCRTVYLVAKQ